MQRRPEVIELVPQQRDTVTIPSCFLPSSQTGSLWKTSAQQRKATQYERTSNAVLQCTPPPKPRSQSQNTNAPSLPILLMVLLCDLQGGSDCTAPSLTSMNCFLLFFSGTTCIHTGPTTMTSYRTTKSGIGWPGKRQGERIQNQTGSQMLSISRAEVIQEP